MATSSFPKPWVEVCLCAASRPALLKRVSVSGGFDQLPTNPNDLTANPGGPEQEGRRGKRKQTLLSLLDALAELSKDGELDGYGMSISQPLSSARLCRHASSCKPGHLRLLLEIRELPYTHNDLLHRPGIPGVEAKQYLRNARFTLWSSVTGHSVEFLLAFMT